ncbi:MAG: acyltransferase [Chloroflexi bacterium]|nr:acyltransferase [Chloroflexota bacterium]
MLGYELTNRSLPPIQLQARGQDAQIRIGASSSITNGCEIVAQKSVIIGEHCLIGPETVIYDSDFHGIAPEQRHTKGRIVPVILADNVWVGKRAMILKGVTIGRDAVIAASAIVVKDVPAGAIVGGNPARIIGSVYETVMR